MTVHPDASPRLVYAGIDTLYAAFQGAAPKPVLERLAIAQAEARARRDNDPEIVELGPDRLPFRVDGHGQRGGYHYRLTLPDPLAPAIAIRHNETGAEWNGFVSIGAMALLGAGHTAAFQRALDMLEAIGFRWLDYSLNRVDYAMDFMAPQFQLDPDRFVAHNRTTGRLHYSDRAATGQNAADWRVQPVMRGRRCESFTLGKLPRLQVIVYDKRREAIEQHKPWWFEAWGLKRSDEEARVWRVEVRSGGEHLKYRWGARNLDLLAERLPSIVARSLATIRYLAPEGSDSNVTRRELDPLWRAATDHARRCLLRDGPALDPDALREFDRQQVNAILASQVIGCAGAIAHLRGIRAEGDEPEAFIDLMRDLASSALADPKRPVQGAITRAAKRYGGE